MKLRQFGMIVGIALLSACGSGSPSLPSIDSIVTQTLQALTSQPQVIPTQQLPATSSEQSPPSTPEMTTPEGTNISLGGISLLLPNGMGSNATSVSTTEVELPFINPSLGDMPGHIKISISDYPVQGSMFKPVIMVFKSEEYARYSELTTQVISALHNLEYQDGQPLPQGIPAGPAFTAQIHGLTFQNGKGLRFLTQYDQAPIPANNNELFYNFHGLTTDGQYYVQAILPTQVSFLPADGNPNAQLPPAGVPFNMDDVMGYFNLITQKLNATDPFSFTPYLDHLDSMIGSLLVKGF